METILGVIPDEKNTYLSKKRTDADLSGAGGSDRHVHNAAYA